MKKLVVVFLILGMSLPVLARAKSPKNNLSVGMSQNDIKKSIGKPSVMTKDYNGAETWIYENVRSIDIKGSSNFGNVNADAKNTTIVIKFNSDKKVEQFSYQKSVH